MRTTCVAMVALMVTSFIQAGDDLAKVLAPVTTAESYAFTVANASEKAVECKYQKGMPLSVRADGIDFFRQDQIMVYEQGGVWQRTRTGTLSDPLRILIPSAKVRAIRLPHEELAILSKGLKNVKKDAMTLTGELPADAAKSLARTEDRDLARGGSVKLWLDAQGRLVKYETSIRVQGRRGNAEVDGTVVKTVTLSNVGMTKVNVPAEAKKALAGEK